MRPSATKRPKRFGSPWHRPASRRRAPDTDAGPDPGPEPWSCPGLVDGDASSGGDRRSRTIALLELLGTELAEAGVAADPVVEDLDELEDRGPSFGRARP